MIHENRQRSRSLAVSILDELPLLATKIATSTNSKPADASILLTEVVRFMHLISVASAPLTPSLPVDLAWHEFILFTKPYSEYCDREFGRMIHHHPGGSDENNRKQFANTVEMYRQYYGAPDVVCWGDGTTIASSDCGECESPL